MRLLKFIKGRLEIRFIKMIAPTLSGVLKEFGRDCGVRLYGKELMKIVLGSFPWHPKVMVEVRGIGLTGQRYTEHLK